jgi:hypothetical protein
MAELHQTILEQLGGRKINGALAYTGCSQMIELDSYTASFVVNGRENITTLFHVTLTPKDLYDIHIREVDKGEIKYRQQITDIYGEDLQATFEEAYDNLIQERNDGFINLDS